MYFPRNQLACQQFVPHSQASSPTLYHDIMDSFAAIFSECQRSIATHKKCIKAATVLVSSNKKAIKEFISCVDRILVVDKRHPAIERCVSFIGNFIGTYSVDAEDKPVLWYASNPAKSFDSQYSLCSGRPCYHIY